MSSVQLDRAGLDKELWEETLKYIPNGCQTLSKSPARYIPGVYPRFLTSGHGSEVYDISGTRYFDYISGLGTNLLGYNNPAVDDAVKETILSGQVLLSLPHPKELELAKKLAKFTNMEQFKFFKTGSEATSAAIRVARAYTGRNVVLMCGYNGWHDWAAITYDRQAGIPHNLNTRIFKYNDIESLKARLTSQVAAVILEPVIFDEPKNNFLEDLVQLARRWKAIIIFDEIVTGLRFGHNGASGLLGIQADLVCLGKALGNGYSIAALGGPKEIMSVFERDDFLVSGTFNGELTGISAALAVLENLDTGKLWDYGTILKTGFNNICNELDLPVKCIGYAPRTRFDFPSEEHRALFWQECVKKGILFGYTNFVTCAHGIHTLQHTLSICREALSIVKMHWDDPKSKLEGPCPLPAIRSTR